MKLPRWGPVSRSSDLLSQSCPLVVGFVGAGTLKGQETQTPPRSLSGFEEVVTSTKMICL